MPTLESRLTLHRFICAQFGYPDLREMLAQFADLPPEPGGAAASRYAQALALRWQSVEISPEKLGEYDNNITAHSRELGMHADSEKSWKPFQYAALLFTEHYLDLYFADADALLDALNAWQERMQEEWAQEEQAQHGRRGRRNARTDKMAKYKPNDLRTLAFQSATGSGKTLLLHANILQYKHYLQQSGRLHKLNKVILVTPDEGLSRQHLSELRASNIPAQLFSGDAPAEIFSRGGGMVDIIDLHKLDENAGIKRVALGAFEDNNLVMVDEGHLGAKGNAWRKRRKQLASNGFTFEYSATFNQVAAGDSPLAKKLRNEYGKSILFDYSYRFFHGAGYGKDYQISNLRDTADAETNKLYLLACLLVFYQQCKIYAEKGGQWREFRVAKPLWAFLGRTVTGGKKDSETETTTDVERIINFLAWALGEPQRVTAAIKQVIGGDAGLVDKDRVNLFGGAFAYIGEMPAPEIYADLCELVFRAPGELQVVHLTGTNELQLSAGGEEPFGVINVGDASGLYTILEKQAEGRYQYTKNDFRRPLFANVDHDSSPVNIVIGARKFVAGWNSWRVSTMGLMHVGTGEGPQIIQMFGRGVRLKGWNMSLKRHTKTDAPQPLDSGLLHLLETLNIFGLKANYMEQFKEYLQTQGIAAEMVEISLPTKDQFAGATDWKILRKQDGIGDFELSHERIALPEQPDERKKIRLDRYAHLQTLQSDGARAGGGNAAAQEGKLEKWHVDLLNKQRVYHRVLARKQRSAWHNMTISAASVNALLESDGDWYTLHIPPEKLEGTHYARVREWEELAADLICKYADSYWRHARNVWEHRYLEAAPLEDADSNDNRISEHVVSVDAKEKKLIAAIRGLTTDLESGKYDGKYPAGKVTLKSLHVGFHAYTPLLHVQPEHSVKITPVPLNDGEAAFVAQLQEAAADPQSVLAGKNAFLLRNQSRGKGISFFDDHSFYPDFILCVKDGDAQHILFIDPKSLEIYNAQTESKVELHKRIKETEAKVQEKTAGVFLHSYVWSTTDHDKIGSDTARSVPKWRAKGVYLSGGGSRELNLLIQNALTRGRK